MDIYTQYIFYELENDKSFAKIIIKENKEIYCENETIRIDIANKIQNIQINKYFHFTNELIIFASLIEYGIIPKNYNWKYYENLPFIHLPIYKKNTSLEKYLELIFAKDNQIEIFETKRYKKKENYWFSVKEECKNYANQWVQTNPEFEKFSQHIYHAGNNQQLERFAYIYFRTMFSENNKQQINLSNNNWNNQPISFAKEIYNTTYTTIKHTMNYMMNKMKKGILIAIKNNQLLIFLPFSKENYENTFWKELYFDKDDKELLQKIDKLMKIERRTQEQNNLLKYLQKKSESNVYEFLKQNKLPFKDIYADRKKWVANDCFFRYENYEGDRNTLLFYHFMIELCKNRKLNDAIFILNVRDHPVLDYFMRDSYSSIICEPLEKKYIHSSYCPIFSVGCEHTKLDLPFITQDDWSQISQNYYLDDCENGYIGTNDFEIIKWENKKEKAVFRGSATGCGIGMDNIRIIATKLSETYPHLIDAGITTLNRKVKKKLGEPLIVSNFKIQLATKMTWQEKASYKYILNLDGHVSAFRLGHEFSLGSLILLPLSPYYLWFSSALKPFIHYIPVHPKLKDLPKIIQWCKENDDYCKQIAENGRLFYETYLSKDGVFDYMQYMISKIAIDSEKFMLQNKYLENYNDYCIGIVSVFRDNNNFARIKQKRYFCYWMDKLMKNVGCDYEIVIVEQNEKDKFNIGKLKNIGYDLLKKTEKEFTNIIFTDIDMIPDTDLFEYFFKPMDGICALAMRGTRYTTMIGHENSIFVGGMVCCTSDIYETINGFPNNFYGWKGEDENVILRISETTKRIYIPEKGSVMDIEENDNFERKGNLEKREELKKNNEDENLAYEKNFDYMNFTENGLSNLQYKINYYNYWNHGMHVIVDLLYEESTKKYPHHYFYNSALQKTDYKTFMQQKKKLIRQIPY